MARNQPSVPSVEPEVQPPKFFKGSRSCSVSDFKDALQTMFLLQPRRFPDDNVKVLFISTLLRDSALVWYKSLRMRNDPALRSTSAFWEAFTTRFEPTLLEEELENRLLNITLRQNESIEEFNARFFNLATIVAYEDRALRGIYMNALTPDLLTHLHHMNPIPKTLADTIQAVEIIDSRNRQIMARKARFSKSSPPKKQESPATTTPPTSEPTSTSGIKFKKLDRAEIERRKSLNLCIYCGQPGHAITECPVKKSKN